MSYLELRTQAPCKVLRSPNFPCSQRLRLHKFTSSDLGLRTWEFWQSFCNFLTFHTQKLAQIWNARQLTHTIQNLTCSMTRKKKSHTSINTLKIETTHTTKHVTSRWHFVLLKTSHGTLDLKLNIKWNFVKHTQICHYVEPHALIVSLKVWCRLLKSSSWM